MDIDIEFFRKLNPGGFPESYADRLKDCIVRDLSSTKSTLESRL